MKLIKKVGIAVGAIAICAGVVTIVRLYLDTKREKELNDFFDGKYDDFEEDDFFDEDLDEDVSIPTN